MSSEQVARIFDGERDFGSLTAAIDDMDTACVKKILDLIEELRCEPARAVNFPSVHQLTEPKPHVKAFCQRHRGEFAELADATGDPDMQGEWEEGELTQWEDQGAEACPPPPPPPPPDAGGRGGGGGVPPGGREGGAAAPPPPPPPPLTCVLRS
eukprot:SAG22_NODE_2766_length_2228_cov_1.450446_4_plen_154_part_00